MTHRLLLPWSLLGALAMHAASNPASQAQPPEPEYRPTDAHGFMGDVERLDPAIDGLVPPGARIERLAQGFQWSEGPVWLKQQQRLLFSDVPHNVIHSWKEGEGLTRWLAPAGFTGDHSESGEPGSNGLALDAQGRLLLCQHGDRRVARLDAPLSAPTPDFTTLADKHQGKRFNSPNDLCVHTSGAVYFTDPPYGLPKRGEDDPDQEIPFCGVYRWTADGGVQLVCDKMTRPNGVALSPDERTLYVAQSDGAAPIIQAFDLGPDGLATGDRLFFDGAELAKTRRGAFDGLKVDRQGNLFATGPGGVLVLTPDGRHLGTIQPGGPTANCAFGGDEGRTLYMTSGDTLCRIPLSTTGHGF